MGYRAKPAHTRKILGLDSSAGAHRATDDYSARVLLEADAGGMFYVDAELAREPVDRGVRLALQRRPHAIGIEATAFQAVLAGEWRRQATVAGVHLPPQLIHNADNKLLRIRRLGPALAQHRLRFSAASWGAREVVNQLRDFPRRNSRSGSKNSLAGIRRSCSGNQHRARSGARVATRRSLPADR